MTYEGTMSVQSDGSSEKQFYFPRGIPGFETYTTFYVFHKQENDLCAYWLESVAEPKLTFTLVDPTDFDLHYELALTDEEQDLLQVENAESCAVLLMLAKKNGQDATQPNLTAHISGPLVINLATRIGLQKVLKRSHVNVSIVEDECFS